MPSLCSSPAAIMRDGSSRGCVSCWVQRASLPRSWPVFVPSAPLHSGALCDSVRPGWVIKKARAQVVIIRGLSTTGCRRKKRHEKAISAFLYPASRSHCCLRHCLIITAALKCSVNRSHRHLRTLPTNISCTVNTHIHAGAFFSRPRCSS